MCVSLRVVGMSLLVVVTLLMAAAAHVSGSVTSSTAPPVAVTIFYESLSAASRDYIPSQVYAAWCQLYWDGAINVTLVAYGRTREEYRNGTWHFACPRGERECLANMISACAVHYHRNQTMYLPLVQCMLDPNTGGDPLLNGPKCAWRYGIDYHQVQDCATGDLGTQLMHDNALLTRALMPPLTSVPWVTVNGAHTEHIQQMALYELITLVCETYTGPPPQACE